jgi:hypothetical protein
VGVLGGLSSTTIIEEVGVVAAGPVGGGGGNKAKGAPPWPWVDGGRVDTGMTRRSWRSHEDEAHWRKKHTQRGRRSRMIPYCVME